MKIGDIVILGTTWGHGFWKHSTTSVRTLTWSTPPYYTSDNIMARTCSRHLRKK